MLNVGGAEFLVIMLVALIVLGPTKLPEVARQVGAMARELRRISSSFQAELKSALDEPVEEAARERGHKIVGSEEPATPKPEDAGKSAVTDDDEPADTEDEPEPEVSTAEAAGMYDVAQAATEVADTGDNEPVNPADDDSESP